VLWRKTGIGEFFNHVASPHALRSVLMTTRGAPPVMLILVDLSASLLPGSVSGRCQRIAPQRIAAAAQVEIQIIR
jgi:hypothetical protein